MVNHDFWPCFVELHHAFDHGQISPGYGVIIHVKFTSLTVLTVHFVHSQGRWFELFERKFPSDRDRSKNDVCTCSFCQVIGRKQQPNYALGGITSAR